MKKLEQEEARLRGADYEQADRSCDVVMKGGITSGVVYPLAACELAQQFRFRNVGGTSAGAIAAAATAAAEYGRAKRGFNKLAELPAYLREGHNLIRLFQPQKSTARVYRVLLAKLEGGGLRLAGAVLRSYPLAVLVGSIPGLLFAAAALREALDADGFLLAVGYWAAFVLGLAVLAVGVLLCSLVTVGLSANRRIANNRFGLCNGSPGVGKGEALTPWLHKLLNSLADLPDEEVLTFRHLWSGPDGLRKDLEGEPDDPFLRLAMMTTNLVNRTAHQLPWDEADWLFDPDELADYFPPEVVKWMRDNAATPPELGTKGARRSRVRRALAAEQGLLPLPCPADMPVVVATRMSLSFPVLLSAVPLWRFDMTSKPTAERMEAFRAWAKEQPEDWDPLAEPVSQWAVGGPSVKRPQAEPCWFSDGGISSNFPVHFFDHLVPRWPTFAINLRPFAFGVSADADEAKNVWMVKNNREGSDPWWYRLPVRKRLKLDKRLFAFLGSAVKTMQNRVDEAQMRVPGYRDRVAHVSLADDEGGLNLSMPPERIEALTERGRLAAVRLADAYTKAAPGQVITWDNHRWVRFRSSIAVLETMSTLFASGFDEPPLRGEEVTYSQLVDDPPSYPLAGVAWQHGVALAEVQAIREVWKTVDEAPGSMAVGQPKPAPVGRISPKEKPM